MNDSPFQAWLDKTAHYSGVLACGVRLANQSFLAKSYHESFPEARLGELLQCVSEMAYTLRNSRLGSARLRWVFENGQVHSARRPDGVLAVLAGSKDVNAAASIEELIADFLAVGSAPADQPGEGA
jgi:hypothetical protein